MAENDKFERAVGKKWRKCARLLRKDAPTSQIVDEVITATKSVLRDIDCSVLATAAGVVGKFQVDIGAVQLDFFRRDENFQHAQALVELEQVTLASDSELARLAAEEGQRVLVGVRDGFFASERAEDELFNCIAERFAEQQLFARLRDQLINETQRTVEQQRERELGIMRSLKPQLRRLLEAAARTGTKPRRGRRLTARIELTPETLNQPLAAVISDDSSD